MNQSQSAEINSTGHQKSVQPKRKKERQNKHTTKTVETLLTDFVRYLCKFLPILMILHRFVYLI